MDQGHSREEYPTPRVGRLNSLQRVRLELRRVYRDARQGRLEPRDAGRLSLILVAIGNLIRDGEIEERIARLEEAADHAT